MGAEDRHKWQHLWSDTAVLCGSGAESATSQKSRLAFGCVPMLYMELSGATLRVGGAATLQQQFLCEPLTPALPLYCVNNLAHMDAVVRYVSAIRHTLSKLATFHQQLAAQASPTPFRQTPSARLPTTTPQPTQQLLSQTRLIFLVTTTNGQQRLVKFVPCCQNRSQGGTQAHRAWADAQLWTLTGLACKASLGNAVLKYLLVSQIDLSHNLGWLHCKSTCVGNLPCSCSVPHIRPL